MFVQSKAVLRQLSMVATVALGLGVATDVEAAGPAIELPSHDWSFSGPFGKFDPAQLQRGFQVYREVCSSCHSVDLLAFRNLSQPGGPMFSEAQVKALASEYEVPAEPNEDGEIELRPAVPADRFPGPFANENEAKASNGGAYPPDLSVIAKARPDGANYIRALFLGYTDPPEGFDLQEGLSYNEYFPGHQLAMGQQLFEDGIEYSDGTPPTVENYATDVTAFLMWVAEPKLEERHAMGFKVIGFLIILSVLLYLSKKKLFSRIDH